MKKLSKILALVLALVMALSLCACGAQQEAPAAAPAEAAPAAAPAEDAAAPAEQKVLDLAVAGIDGSITLFPVYVAQEKGWFEEAGLNIERLGFTNGPVTMEAIDTWDISVTGIGGVLSGLISYDAVLLGTVGTDDGTQYIFVRPDGEIAAAGTGNNSISDKIVGSADAWKGKSVNCTYGTVLHYLLLKTLQGFDLTAEDVEINWMDMPTCNASFLAGEGDATCVSGEVSFKSDKNDFVVATTGPISETGLQTNIVANAESLADPELREAMKIFLKVFFESCDWIANNVDEASKYMIEWCDYAGNTIDEEVAVRYCTVDPYYTIEDNYNSLHEKASDGGDYCKTQEEILGVLKFFIECESYQPGDDELFLKEGHLDTSLIDELYAEQ